jgi:hypothetical protein
MPVVVGLLDPLLQPTIIPAAAASAPTIKVKRKNRKERLVP